MFDIHILVNIFTVGLYVDDDFSSTAASLKLSVCHTCVCVPVCVFVFLSLI